MKILPYKAGDEHYILELFETSFGKKLLPQFWNWRFADHPSGRYMIMLMWDGDRVVGHYALSPCKMIIQGQELMTALSMTTMTHPDYAGRGIFTQLADALYEEQHDSCGLAAVWGYPNNNSHYGFIKNVKWRNLEQVPTFSVEAKHVQHVSSSVNVVQDFANFKHDVYSQAPARIQLDASYLNWRYMKNPVNKYVVFERQTNTGYSFAVAKRYNSFSFPGQTEVDIMEWEVPDDAVIQSEFLFEIKEYFASDNVRCINMWMPLNDSRHIQLEKLGFCNTAPITYFGVRLLNKDCDVLLDIRNWYYGMGYSDIY